MGEFPFPYLEPRCIIVNPNRAEPGAEANRFFSKDCMRPQIPGVDDFRRLYDDAGDLKGDYW